MRCGVLIYWLLCFFVFSFVGAPMVLMGAHLGLILAGFALLVFAALAAFMAVCEAIDLWGTPAHVKRYVVCSAMGNELAWFTTMSQAKAFCSEIRKFNPTIRVE